MRKMLMFCLATTPWPALADGIHPRAHHEKPEIYQCRDQDRGLNGTFRQFSITRVGQSFRVAFEHSLKPGELRDYLAPLGIDDRIIANYNSWDFTPFEISTSSCQGRTFGSLFAEELTCQATGVKLGITARYRDSRGQEQTDKYTINDAQVRLDTSVQDGLDGTVCFNPKNGIERALHFGFQATFLGTRGQSATVRNNSAFHPYCEIDYGSGDGGGTRWHGDCRLTGLVGLYNIYVSDLIRLRN